MLTGKQIRVRFFRDKIIPIYLDTNEPSWLEAAQRLLELLRGQEGRTRGELEEDLTEAIGNDPSQLIHRGLAKLLEDRCEFEIVSGKPPEEVREVVFTLATRKRRGEIPEGSQSDQGDGLFLPPAFDRTAIVAQAAESFGMT